jgi:NAD(P)-dependent dehydrogenase (short-subunit alcohol dehydrogenase family)
MTGVAVITGTTHGIGRVTGLELARSGAQVLMLCRDARAGEAVRADIMARVPGAAVEVMACDLASLDSVRRCAAAVRRACPRLRLLINNAGTVSIGHRMSVDGYELTFATNHLGPFLLTNLLSDHLEDGARIVNVASRAHFRGRMDLEDVDDPRAPYRSAAAYARSKLANVLSTFALARRLAASGVSVNCLHPGVIASNLLPWWLRLVKPLISRPIFDVERGARTTLFLALAPQVAGLSGLYFDEYQVPQAASALARDVTLQESLWQISSRWVGLTR